MSEDHIPAQGPVDVNVRDAITHGGSDRGYKLCRCHQCGEESICTPSNDFYTTESDDEPLKCEACFRSYIRKLKAPNVELTGRAAQDETKTGMTTKGR